MSNRGVHGPRAVGNHAVPTHAAHVQRNHPQDLARKNDMNKTTAICTQHTEELALSKDKQAAKIQTPYINQGVACIKLIPSIA